MVQKQLLIEFLIFKISILLINTSLIIALSLLILKFSLILTIIIKIKLAV